MNTAQETGDMLVVTLPVPTTDARELSVWLEGAVARRARTGWLLPRG